MEDYWKVSCQYFKAMKSYIFIVDTFVKTKNHFKNIDIVINIVRPVQPEKWETQLNRNVVGIGSLNF